MRNYLSDSVYLWACGEKASGQEGDLKASDELIGFLILVFQAVAYAFVIRRSGNPPEDTAYSVTPVTAALYLLVQTASPDLRAGFSLVVDGPSCRHFVVGACMLAAFALLITAAMKVIFSSAEDDAAVVANAVTILFVADLDEKALAFFLTVPQKWRLFWMTNIVSISFALALAGIVYVADASAATDEAEDGNHESITFSIPQAFPTWFVFAVNPAAVTFFSFAMSRLLWGLCEAWPNRVEGSRGAWLSRAVRLMVRAAVSAVKAEPCFYATLCLWFAVSCSSWVAVQSGRGLPFAVVVAGRASSHHSSPFPYRGGGIETTNNVVEVVVANLALAGGLTMLAFRSVGDRGRSPTCAPGPVPNLMRRPAESVHAARDELRCPREDSDQSVRQNQRSRVPSLLVGWGLGYWLISLLYLLACSWPNGGWYGAPLLVTVVAYVAVPLVFVLGVFVVAESNVLGKRIERVLKPVADAVRDDRRVLHWAVVTMLRDVTMVWLVVMHEAVPYLNVV
ncbi:unnamed protein product [Scytosiphon promiscuus]